MTESEAVQRQCLEAARLVLRRLDIDENLEPRTASRLALEAMRDAYEVWDLAKNDDVDVDVSHVVATAFWERLSGIDLTPEDQAKTEPYSIGGIVLEGYAHAARLLEMYQGIQFVIDDEDSGTATHHAKVVLAQMADGDKKA
jgi:hypothetical protein